MLLEPSENSMPEWLHERARSSPEHLALVCGDDGLGIRGPQHTAGRVARGGSHRDSALHGRGSQRGDGV